MSDQPSSMPAPTPPSPSATSVPVEAVFRPRKRGALAKMINAVGVAVVFLSIILNVYLVMALAAMEALNGRSAMTARTLDEGAEDQTVAVYVLSDVIDGEAAGKFKAFFDAVEDNEDVKAVVLRVVSPGGSVSASAEIHRYITLLQEAGKKVVVSMGAVAASGGYYIAAPADLIVAEESTITGSIGVVMTYFVMEETMDSLGLEPIVIKSTNADAWKDEGSPFRQPSAREREHLLALLDFYQEQFENVVTEGRGDRLNTQPEIIEETVVEGDVRREVRMEKTEPFNGKIYSAPAALELGLIDEIGFLAEAIDRAGELAELDDPNVVKYVRRPSFMEQMFSMKSSDPLERGRELITDLQTPRFEMIWRVD